MSPLRGRHPSPTLPIDEITAIADRVLPGSGPPSVDRTTTGASTPVYRLARAGTTHYLRLAETPEASLVPEALAHELLRVKGVRVPEIIRLDPFNEVLQRSIMVTTEIPGRSLAKHHPGDRLPDILAAAGRDLALLNTAPVDGFGWVRRDRPHATRLEAARPTLRAFALGDLDKQLAAASVLLTGTDVQAVRDAVSQREHLLDATSATLAHGDLDAAHIFHLNGAYTGIIDLGEIRGTDPWYDLGHAALHDGETLPDPLLPGLLAGHAEVALPQPDAAHRIHLWSLLIGIGRLARLADRPRSPYHDHLAAAVRRALIEVWEPSHG